MFGGGRATQKQVPQRRTLWALLASGEKVGAGMRDLHIGAALVLLLLAALVRY